MDRYSRSVVVQINKLFGSKSSVHKDIAKLITQFSHSALLEPGDYLEDYNHNFFIVENVISPHTLLGFFCKARYFYLPEGVLYYPDMLTKSKTFTKRIMKPFSFAPRIHHFTSIFRRKGKDEPLQFDIQAYFRYT